MKMIKKFVMMLILTSASAHGTVIYELTYTGDLTGTGIFDYDDTAGSEAINAWTWDFGGGMSGGVSAGTLGSLPPFSALTIYSAVISGVLADQTISLFGTGIVGFPAPADMSHGNVGGTDFVWRIFTGSETLYSGRYTISSVAVPEPSSLMLMSTMLLGLALIRRARPG